MKIFYYYCLFLLYGHIATAELLTIEKLEDIKPVYSEVIGFCRQYPEETLRIFDCMKEKKVLEKMDWQPIYDTLKIGTDPIISKITKDQKSAKALFKQVKNSINYIKKNQNSVMCFIANYSNNDEDQYYSILINDLSIIQTLLSHFIHYQINK